MTVSMKAIHAGRGYDYLLKSVVRGDANMSDQNPVTRYYTEAGTPPGRWMGSALHAFGDGEIKRGDTVTPQQLQLLIGAGLDPVTGDKLGRAFPTFPPLKQRMADRAAELPADLTAEQRKDALLQIKAEESHKPSSGVAGFDLTFSVPKSVSALWGVADAGTQALIVEAHHQAVAEVVDFIEREVACTRRGVAAGAGTPGSAIHSSIRTSSSPTRSRRPMTGDGAAWTGGHCSRPTSRSPSTTTPCSPTA